LYDVWISSLRKMSTGLFAVSSECLPQRQYLDAFRYCCQSLTYIYSVFIHVYDHFDQWCLDYIGK
jgi:hypothetical protein